MSGDFLPYFNLPHSQLLLVDVNSKAEMLKRNQQVLRQALVKGFAYLLHLFIYIVLS